MEVRIKLYYLNLIYIGTTNHNQRNTKNMNHSCFNKKDVLLAINKI